MAAVGISGVPEPAGLLGADAEADAGVEADAAAGSVVGWSGGSAIGIRYTAKARGSIIAMSFFGSDTSFHCCFSC